MQITKDFLVAEIGSLGQEIQKAQAFVIKAQGTIEAYQMLINRLDAPEPEQQDDNTNQRIGQPSAD